jgi:hypothetical protein
MIEAFFHALYFLEMMVKYGRILASPPRVLPSGWAAVLTLYGLGGRHGMTRTAS